MRTCLTVALVLLASAATAKEPARTVFVRVDAVRLERSSLVVVGETDREGAVEWVGNFGLSNLSIADLATPEVFAGCTRMAMQMMDRPGEYRLELSFPERDYPTCSLVRVPPKPAAEPPRPQAREPGARPETETPGLAGRAKS